MTVCPKTTFTVTVTEHEDSWGLRMDWPPNTQVKACLQAASALILGAAEAVAGQHQVPIDAVLDDLLDEVADLVRSHSDITLWRPH